MVKHVPLVVEVCIGNIEAHGLDSQGIYRIPGNAGVVHQLQELLDRVSIWSISNHTARFTFILLW